MLTITGAPSIMGGSFAPNNFPVSKNGLGWVEMYEVHRSHTEAIVITFDYATNKLDIWGNVVFILAQSKTPAHEWACKGSASNGKDLVNCKGITVNRSEGTVTFSNTELATSIGTGGPPITLNGTLTFPPF